MKAMKRSSEILCLHFPRAVFVGCAKNIQVLLKLLVKLQLSLEKVQYISAQVSLFFP